MQFICLPSVSPMELTVQADLKRPSTGFLDNERYGEVGYKLEQKKWTYPFSAI